uniref:Putative ixodes 8-cys protein n=1 Tax=Ixodes ricinus TaxID=34613 RepID=A0A0K8RGK9_IXORI
MLNLRIFILVVITGLCFGASLEGGESSGKGEGVEILEGKGETSSGSGASGSTEKKESTGVSGTNGEKKEPEGDSSKKEEGAGTEDTEKNDGDETTERKNRTLGSDLPDYIGSLDERRNYMVELLGACGGQSQEFKINEKEISFHNCTYTCVRRNLNLTPEVRRIPEGFICNRDKGKCPRHGDCPLPMC